MKFVVQHLQSLDCWYGKKHQQTRVQYTDPRNIAWSERSKWGCEPPPCSRQGDMREFLADTHLCISQLPDVIRQDIPEWFKAPGLSYPDQETCLPFLFAAISSEEAMVLGETREAAWMALIAPIKRFQRHVKDNSGRRPHPKYCSLSTFAMEEDLEALGVDVMTVDIFNIHSSTKGWIPAPYPLGTRVD